MSPRGDVSAFLRPIAHRGLHGAASGRVENTGPAFQAAIDRGFGVECDVRAAAHGLPVVFHDETIERLIDGTGPVARLTRADLARLSHREGGAPILTFADTLDLVAGRVPILAEIKSEWRPLDPGFLDAIARAATAYGGPIAFLSFDPEVLVALAERAPAIPRGMIARIFQGEGWRTRVLGAEKSYRLSHLLDFGRAKPSLIAYFVGDLPTPVTRFVREVLDVPLLAWTVRTEAERRIAAAWADAPIFEETSPANQPGDQAERP